MILTILPFQPHHKWIVPTPFASHAFHPLDGYVQSIPYHLFVYIIPMNKWLYIAMFIFVNCWTVMIHDGKRSLLYYLTRSLCGSGLIKLLLQAISCFAPVSSIPALTILSTTCTSTTIMDSTLLCGIASVVLIANLLKNNTMIFFATIKRCGLNKPLMPNKLKRIRMAQRR